MESKEVNQHIDDLRKVFEQCRKYILRKNPLKCSFRVSTGKFLGLPIHGKGIDLDKAKAKAFRDVEPFRHMEPPTMIK